MREISGIVGLDLSITGSGVVRYDVIQNKYDYIETIGTKPIYGSIIERLEFSAATIISKIKKDDTVFIEDYAFGVHPGISRLASLAELGGIIKLLVHKKTGRQTIQMASTSIKKWLSGSGKLPHSDFKIAAYKKYNIEFKTKDEVIAYSMVDFGCNLLIGHTRRLFKYEMDVLDNFTKKHPEIVDVIRP